MRLSIFIILFICNFSFCQQEDAFLEIDSLKKTVFNIKKQDSSLIADTHYLIAHTFRKSTTYADSAYFYYQKAEKIYRSLGNNFKLARTIYGIAVILKNEKDFIGSEVASFEAIALLEPLYETRSVTEVKSYIYNNLGIVFKELDEFDESIEYNKKALELKYRLNVKSSIDASKNNLANTYKKNKQYNLALNYYSEILSNKDLVKERPRIFSLVLDNYAHTRFLSGNLRELPGLYLKALKVSNSVGKDDYYSIIINQHLSEYYFDNKRNIDSAKYYAYKAKNISEKYYTDDLLKSLLLLSKIEEDHKAVEYFNAYIKLSDSLQKNERNIRNRFARIRFETGQKEKENIQLTKERMWLFIISVVVVISSFLLYLVITQRNKNIELKFVQKQQETNEEIYNLMLSQNESIEEARDLEKRRISQELHDGVLGRLFGTRLSLDSLNRNNSDEAVKSRDLYITELKTIEDEIRKVSHELNTDFVSGSGFIDIIKTLIETQTLAYGLSYNLDYDESISWEDVNNKKKIHVYRIIQETLHNIYKHANAESVNISLKLKNDVICLSIKDNGSGYDVRKARSGIGLKNMNSRINDINGILKITSIKNQGTTVVIEVPML
ncbi:tetratricopeptide repeat-containing sensor histidine kinase [Algibacter sp. L1A34]|uniref:tetratricopeptide repeat-containing sensor histidine kinase n=1 Tax=Algibacter sp. L1A34 TaxID=2686365 RepID=UPI00131D6A6B|nr:tetratricopeptide repeat-containing sensor histidine kinase [Algibacter sp. L1A34]